MKITCIHCGGAFSITTAHLGSRGFCPHCKGEITLPSADEQPAGKAKEHPPEPLFSLTRLVSFLTSFVIHLTTFVMLGLPWAAWMGCEGGIGGPGEFDEVLIGELPSESLSANQDASTLENESPSHQTMAESDQLQAELPRDPGQESSDVLDVTLATPSPSGGGAGEFDLGAVGVQGGGSMAGGGWEGMLQNLRRTGLDIIITFDSTGSMSGEIREVKDQIKRIGASLLKLVPKARIGICTYRDEGDEFVAKGLPLTGSIQEVATYLDGIRAGGGGDHPEAVHEGLRWSIENNAFRPGARKVILVFGDAPPHAQKLQLCLSLASDFNRQQKGIISTVTCRNDKPLPEFYEIAVAGGGEAFLTTDERQLMTQLMVLVFGSRYRSKVVDAFKLLEK